MATNTAFQDPSAVPAVPVRKVGVGAIAGAVVAVGVWIVLQYGGGEIPAQIAAALTVLVSSGRSYLTPAAHGAQ